MFGYKVKSLWACTREFYFGVIYACFVTCDSDAASQNGYDCWKLRLDDFLGKADDAMGIDTKPSQEIQAWPVPHTDSTFELDKLKRQLREARLKISIAKPDLLKEKIYEQIS